MNAPSKLRLGPLTALVVGSMVGGGIFSLPQNTAAGAGMGATVLAWCITGIEVLRYQQHGGTFRRGAGNVGAAQGISIHLNPVVRRLG